MTTESFVEVKEITNINNVTRLISKNKTEEVMLELYRELYPTMVYITGKDEDLQMYIYEIMDKIIRSYKGESGKFFEYFRSKFVEYMQRIYGVICRTKIEGNPLLDISLKDTSGLRDIPDNKNIEIK